MHDDHFAVGGLLCVELDEIGALIDRQPEGGQCVLGRARRRATVRNHQHRLIAPRCRNHDQCEPDHGEECDRCSPVSADLRIRTESRCTAPAEALAGPSGHPYADTAAR